MINEIKKNILFIQGQIEPYTPNIIAVTKYFGIEAIEEAYACGLRDFGESRVSDAVEKINALSDEIRSNSKFHFIGHLQSNKVKKVVEYFDTIHSVDSLKIAELISEEALRVCKVQEVYLQLNNANEEQKFGFSKDELFNNFEVISKLKGIKVLGLMNIAPLGVAEEVLEELFQDVKITQDKLVEKYNCDMKEISMGMSNDYQIAVKCGATVLRIGRKLFSKS